MWRSPKGIVQRKGLTDEKAARMLEAFRCGSTLRGFAVTKRRFDAYCDLNPEYARTALPLLATNYRSADKRKGHLGRRTHCAQGHSLLDPANVRIVIEPAGWRRRMCLACRHRIENSGGEMKAEQVAASLQHSMEKLPSTK